MTMFDFNIEVENIKARCEEIRREFEEKAQMASVSHEQPPFYAGALVGVGKALVKVGSWLQAQYSTDYSTNHSTSEPESARPALDTSAAAS